VTTLPLTLDRTSPVPLGAQLAGRVRELIGQGALEVGNRLPSTRALALDLGVSRSIAEQAYDQLLAEGWLEGRRGSGTFVAASRLRSAPPKRTQPPRPPRTASLVRLDTGTPWIDPRHRDGWRRAWREVSTLVPPAGYPDPAGLPELREALAAHLARTRGLTCTADQIVLTSGTTDGLRQVLTVLGPGPLAVEDPGYRAAVMVARGLGRDVVDVPVGPAGLDLHGVPPDAAAVYVTPAHQHPTGVTLPAGARVALLELARRHDIVVVEDDYDSEFRYDVAPLPALATLDPERVVYLGTASKSVAPGLRLGWLVAPNHTVEAVTDLLRRTHDLPSWPTQRAYLAMLRDGHVDRLIRSARRVYAARGAAVERDLPVVGPIAGMYVALPLSARQTRATVRAAEQAGFELPTLEEYARSHGRTGVVFGFGGLSDAEFELALTAIRLSITS
jgi:GntR family transcriptional regulator/MocR family aminotransferase